MDEFLITVNAASALLDMDQSEDDGTPDPIDEGMDLAREAAAQVEEIRKHYDELLRLVTKAYKFTQVDPDPDMSEVDRFEIDLRHALKAAGTDTEALDRSFEAEQEDED